MKKLNLSWLLTMLLLSLTSFSAFADSLSIEPFGIAPGTEKEVEVKINASGNYVGFQTEITLPDGLSFVQTASGQYVSLPSGDTSHQVVGNNPDQTLKVVGFSKDFSPYTDGNPVFIIKVKITGSTFSKGMINISKTIFSDTDNKEVPGTEPPCEVSLLPSSIYLTPTSVELKDGESKQLTATLSPISAVGNITWSSSDETKATVNSRGLVTAKSVTGEVTITASCGDIKSTCKVTVVPTPATSISLDKKTASLKATETVKLTATIMPENTTDKTVSWTTSDEGIATVDANGLVTAVAVGNATITATVGEKSATCDITVIETPAESISLNKSEATLKATETVDLIATILPETTTNKNITWTSSDEAIAKVDANGKVTAVAVGTANIKATAASGVSASCKITVAETKATSVTIDKTAMGITGDNIEMRVGDTKEIMVTLEPATTTDKSVTYTSSNPSVASVDGEGTITALALGETTITITAKSGVSTTITVKVVATEVTSVSLNKTTLTLKATESETLVATVLPANATDKSVKWTTSDASVATVDANGKVTAIAVGNATITATAGGESATCNVTVEATEAESISLNYSVYSLKVSESVDLVATVQPETTTDKTVTWTTSDASVATVDANGKVTGIKVGSATITATAKSGVSASCTINVVKTDAGTITLDKTEATLKATETVQLTATILPETTTDKTVNWSSSNPAIATVDNNGKVTAIAVGTANITATAASRITASCKITVVETPAATITLNKTEASLKATETVQLTATIRPETTTDKSVTWKSSDESIATVDASGKVTAVAVGTADITATAASGIYASCKITVAETPATSVTIDKTAMGITGDNLQMHVGDTKAIKVTVAPESTTDKSVTYTSSNPAVASVDTEGLVKALTIGTTTITIKAKSGVSTTINVNVVATDVASVSLNKTALTLKATESETLVATVLPADATNKTVTWTTSDASIATVDANGKVTAVKVGKATITATAGGKSATCAVTVNATAAESVTLNYSVYSLKVTESVNLEATVLPASTTDKTITWTTSDASVATVDANGKVTGVKVGSATITATAKSGVSASCTINVVSTDAGTITLNKTEATLKATETVQLTATILPETTTDKTVKWTTSDAAIATVDANGKVTAVAVGTANITATAVSGISASCKITVVETPAATITLNKTSASLKATETLELTATVLPATATDKTVKWSSSNEAVATVDANGKVTAVAVGNATITATSNSTPTVKAECAITVVETPATSVTIDKTAMGITGDNLQMHVGDTKAIKVTVAPETTTDKSVTYTSCNPAVASVDADGLVKALAIGTTTITIKAKSGVSTTINVNVVATDVASISLNKTALTLKATESETLVATVLPADATNKTVTWSSSDATIATVDANGKVTAVKVGTATITATAGGKSATCAVTVEATAAESVTLNYSVYSLKVTESVNLEATVLPASTTDKTITWTTSDASVATVDANGKVTGVKVGSATITATAKSGVSASCTINVVSTDAGTITLNKTEATLKATETVQLTATILPETTTDKTVKWTTSDAAIATVDANGKVTAVAVGTANITATAVSGISASCKITVVETPATDVTIDMEASGISGDNIEMQVGATKTIKVTVAPETTTDKSVTFASSNPAIASVDEEGTVTALAIGETTITITAKSGASTSIKVKVVETPAASITLNVEEATIDIDESLQLTATVLPANATDKTISWMSANPDIASVDGSGLVTGISHGTTIVTAATASGLTATCIITVNHGATAPVTVTRSPELNIVKDGEAVEMWVSVSGGNPDGFTFSWTHAGNEIGTGNTITVTGHADGDNMSTADYMVRIMNEIDGVAVFDQSFGFIVETWPLPSSEMEITSSASTPSGTSDMLKVREGAAITLSASTPEGGFGEGWTIDWKIGNATVASGQELDMEMTMQPGREQQTDNVSIAAVATNRGPEGDIWGEASAEFNIAVYRRPATPTQLLRKGNGSSSTLIAMSELTDGELSELGYTFVYGYTDSFGDDHLLATTARRYVQIDRSIFDDILCDKWVYAQWQYSDGSIVTSGRRYLDGEADEDFDASDFSGAPAAGHMPDFSDPGNWIRRKGNGINISVENEADTKVEIFNTNGQVVSSSFIPGGTFSSIDFDAAHSSPGIYIIAVTSGDIRKIKKVILK
ncbi:MAG: Ig-like domain-containing protein [Bacteroidales bacterium]|nr:Ig-like domain-containing protein [Bacteroidales bacterium]